MDAVLNVEKPPPTLMKTPPTRQRRMPETKCQALRFTPTAWAKLLFLRDLGPTEVGGFGISAPNDLLLIEDIQMVRQRCTAVTVQFDDAAVADFFDEQFDRGLEPERFARVWIHTHPGYSAAPSMVDEETFLRSFGCSDWAVMFILAQGGQATARLRFNVGPGGELELPVSVDFQGDFESADRSAWKTEYDRCVCLPPPVPVLPRESLRQLREARAEFENDSESLEEFEQRLRDGEEDELWLQELFAQEVAYGRHE